MRALLVMAVGGIAGSLTFAGAASAEAINACVTIKTGIVRIVAAGVPCKNGETALQWNTQGPPGPKGDTGTQGIQGIQGIQGLKGDKGDPALAPLQYVDTAGTVVGRHAVATLEYTLSSGSQSIRFMPVAVATINGLLVTIPVATSPTSLGQEAVWFAPFPASIYFTSTDCSGPGLLSSDNGFIQPTLPGARNGRVFWMNGKRMLHVPAEGDPILLQSTYSYMNTDGICRGGLQSYVKGSWVESVIDLGGLYAEPLSLE